MPAVSPASAFVSPGRPRALWGVLAGTVAAMVLVFNAAACLEATGMAQLNLGWRGWDDIAIATGSHVSGDYPVAPYPIRNRFRRNSDAFAAFRGVLLEQTTAQGIRSSRFWQTIPGAALGLQDLNVARRFDDAGRAWLLAAGFDGLGGVAPFLLPWLAVLLTLPLLIWASAELFAVGRPITAVVFASLLSLSAFVVDVLTLGYSAVGFYLAGLLLLVPLTVYAFLARPTLRGLVVRAAFAGVFLSICIACRSASLLLLPGYALALGGGTFRALDTAVPRKRWGLAVAGAVVGLGLLLIPRALIEWRTETRLSRTLELRGMNRRPPQEHDIWITLWQGLGDFDRTKGHVYLDMAGEKAVLAAGGDKRLSPKSEAILRDLVLRDIQDDPLWFAGILAKRAAATATQWKLRPWRPRDGYSIAPATTENEGVTDNYYRMIAQADWFRLGTGMVEVPVTLLLAPAAVVLLAGLWPRRDSLRETLQVWTHGRAVLLCVGIAAIAVPVWITTASAFEAEAFVVVHFLGAGFFADGIVSLLRRMAQRPPTANA